MIFVVKIMGMCNVKFNVFKIIKEWILSIFVFIGLVVIQ